ncbi:unnamed protein product, partial [Brugia pahangi]|uniref:Ovule protein n=1 Tax=Brugia pahangi TaxID=6280 RepID=A0A0N4TEE5_BRUPA
MTEARSDCKVCTKINLATTLWHASCNNTMACILQQHYGMHLATTLWHASCNNTMACILQQHYGMHLATTLWH